MTKLIAAAVLLLAVAIPTAAAAHDNHYMSEVRAVAGVPSESHTGMCGGSLDYEGKRIPRWECVTWFYVVDGNDLNGTVLIMSFDAKTKKLMDISASKNGEMVGPKKRAEVLDFVHKKLHNAAD